MSPRRLIWLSYLSEILLSVLLVVLLTVLSIDISWLISIIKDDLGTVLSFYGLFAAISLTTMGFVVTETDKDFIKWLDSKKAESKYRDASFYSVSIILLSFVFTSIFRGIPHVIWLEKILLVFLFQSIIVTFTQIKMTKNYFDLKRLYQIRKR